MSSLFKQIFLLGSILSFHSAQIFGNPYAYAEVYRPLDQARIDIVFDRHTHEKGLSPAQLRFHARSLPTLKPVIFPTEARMLTALENINNFGERVDLIWEAYPSLISTEPAFMGCCGPLVKKTFTSINFIYGDQRRIRFEKLFNVMLNGVVLPRSTMDGGVFDIPMPLSLEWVNDIIKNSGLEIWQNYKRYYDEKIKALQDYFRASYTNQTTLDHEQHFHRNSLFHEMADLEFLAHILASDKKRIILYAGGNHCVRILKFLTDNRFEQRSLRANQSYDHLTVDFLEGLDRDLQTAVKQTQKPAAFLRANNRAKIFDSLSKAASESIK